MKRVLIYLVAVLTTANVAAQRVSVTDFAAAKVGDDWAEAFTAAFAKGSVVTVPRGEYRCSEISVPSNITIIGEGDATRFIPLGRVLFSVEGRAARPQNISGDMADFSSTIPLASTAEFGVGDDVLLIGQRNSLMAEDCGEEWTLGRTYKKNVPFGEFVSVARVDSCGIECTVPTVFPFYRRDAHDETRPAEYSVRREGTTVQRLEMVQNAHLSNFSVESRVVCTNAVLFGYAKNCSATAVNVHIGDIGDRYCAFAVNRSKCVECRNCGTVTDAAVVERLQSMTSGGFKNYSRYNLFRILASTDCGFRDCSSDFSTHAFNISSTNGWIPSVGCYVVGCRAEHALWAGVIVQQGCINSLLADNRVSSSAQGVVSGGRNTIIRRNRVVCELPLTTNYYYAHIKRGGTSGVGVFEGYAQGTVIERNRVEGTYTGILIIDGYEERNTFQRCNIAIRRNRVKNCVNGFYIYKSKHNKSTQPLGVTIERNKFTCNATLQTIGSQCVATYGARLCRGADGITFRGNVFKGFGHEVAKE